MKYFLITLMFAVFTISFAFAEEVDAERLFYTKCISCHSAALSLNKTKSLAEWESTAKRMRGRGAKVSSDDIKIIANFLYERKK